MAGKGWRFGYREIDKIKFKGELDLPTFPERGKQTHDSVRKLELEQNLTIHCKDIIKRQMANGRELKVTTKSPDKNLKGVELVVEIVLQDEMFTTVVGTFGIPTLNKSHLVQFTDSTDAQITVDWHGRSYPVGLPTNLFEDELTSNYNY